MSLTSSNFDSKIQTKTCRLAIFERCTYLRIKICKNLRPEFNYIVNELLKTGFHINFVKIWILKSLNIHLNVLVCIIFSSCRGASFIRFSWLNHKNCYIVIEKRCKLNSFSCCTRSTLRVSWLCCFHCQCNVN